MSVERMFQKFYTSTMLSFGNGGSSSNGCPGCNPDPDLCWDPVVGNPDHYCCKCPSTWIPESADEEPPWGYYSYWGNYYYLRGGWWTIEDGQWGCRISKVVRWSSASMVAIRRPES